jgi:gamma-glutamylputrescine oxidase
VPAPASLWQRERGARRFPALAGDAQADVCVVGAGVTGLACARRLAAGGADVVVLEAERVAAGASGRNGGFASAGTGLALPDAGAVIGTPAAFALHRATDAALDLMLATAAAQGDPGAVRRTGSLWLAAGEEAAGMRAALAALAAHGIEWRDGRDLVPTAMRAHYEHAAVFPRDCVLQPARWTRALAAAAASAGARIHERSAVLRLKRRRGRWKVRTAGGVLSAGAVVCACDGLLPRLVPELAGVVYPVRGQMLATTPLAHTVLSAPAHSDHGFVYGQQTPDGRLALGGCRTAALEAEYTDVARPTLRVQRALERFAAGRMGLTGVEVTHRWAGIMGFSADRLPLAGEVPGRRALYVGGGYSGVGNVQGFVCGGLVADLIAGRGHDLAGPLSPQRFAVGGRLRPAAELREQAESRRLAPRLAF